MQVKTLMHQPAIIALHAIHMPARIALQHTNTHASENRFKRHTNTAAHKCTCQRKSLQKTLKHMPARVAMQHANTHASENRYKRHTNTCQRGSLCSTQIHMPTKIATSTHMHCAFSSHSTVKRCVLHTSRCEL